MDLVAWRDDVDAPETRALQPAREHDVAVYPTPPQREGGEAHAHLEGNPRLLWHDRDRTGLLGRCKQALKGRDHLRFATCEVLIEPSVAAEMELVAIGEAAPTFRTRPQLLHPAQLTIKQAWPSWGS